MEEKKKPFFCADDETFQYVTQTRIKMKFIQHKKKMALNHFVLNICINKSISVRSIAASAQACNYKRMMWNSHRFRPRPMPILLFMNMNMMREKPNRINSNMKIRIKNESLPILYTYKDLLMLSMVFLFRFCSCVQWEFDALSVAYNEKKLSSFFRKVWNIHLSTDTLLCLINKYGVDKAHIKVHTECRCCQTKQHARASIKVQMDLK